MGTNVKESHCDGCGVLDDFKDGVVFVRGVKAWLACSPGCVPSVMDAVLRSWVRPVQNGVALHAVPAPPSAAPTVTEEPAKRGRGRPRKTELATVAPGPVVVHDLAGFALKHPGANPNDLTQDQVTELNRQTAAEKQLRIGEQNLHEPPSWCECGRPLTYQPPPLGWICEGRHFPVKKLEVHQGLPGENLSSLVSTAENFGLKLSLVDVASWPVLRRDMLRAWVTGGGKDETTFLEIPVPAPAPALEPQPQPAYTF